MKTWHYEKDGQRHGAVSDTDIGSLIERRAIDGSTLVWSQGFVDWMALAETELASYLRATNAPPALPASKVSNVLVWILALAPIIGLLLEAMIGGAMAPSDDMAELAGAIAVKSGQYWWVTLLLNIGLSILDERRLKKAGIDTSAFGKLVFIVPVYLFKRAKTLGHSPAYFWTWIGMFALSMACSF